MRGLAQRLTLLLLAFAAGIAEAADAPMPPPDQAELARALGELAATQEARGDVSGSIATRERALNLQETLGDQAGAASTLAFLGASHARLGNSSDALAAYERALAKREAKDEKAEVAGVLLEIGRILLAKPDCPAALERFERALAAAEAAPHPKHVVDALQEIVAAHEGMGHPEKAAPVLERVLAIRESRGGKADVAGTWINLGMACVRVGRPARAVEYLERGRALAEEAGKRDFVAKALDAMGVACVALGRLTEALSALQRLLELQRSLGDEAGAARALFLLGGVHQRKADFAKAVGTLTEALARYERLGDRAGAANTLNELGIAHRGLGEYAKSLAAHERSFALREALGDKAGAAAAVINAGGVYAQLGDEETALARYRRGLEMAEAAGNRPWRAVALSNIGAIRQNQGALDEAIDLWTRALGDFETLTDTVQVATDLHNLGHAYHRKGEHAKAIANYERALAMERRVGDKDGEALTLRHLGQTHLVLRDVEKARTFFEDSRRAATSRRLTSTLILVLTDLAWLHLDQGDAPLALRLATEALHETEHVLEGLSEDLGSTARSKFSDLYAIGAVAAARLQDEAEFLTFLESSRAGALLDDLDRREVLQWKAETLSAELQQADREAREKEREVRRAYDAAAKSGDVAGQRRAGAALDEATQGVRDVVERIQRSLKAQTSFYYPRAKSIADLRAALDPDEALVLYGLFYDNAAALVLRPEGERIVRLGRAARVVAACEALDSRDVTTDPEPALVELRKRLVEPLGLDESVRRVLVSPDGPLCYLPFAALFDRPVALTPSGTTHALLLEERREPGQGVLALGDPDYAGVSPGSQALYHRGRVLSALPATRPEVTAIGTKVLLGADASEAKFYEAVEASARWRAVHFACHGLVDVEKPMFSSLALAPAGDTDGFLTAREIRRRRISADLVVLSACETATGKLTNGEGIRGFSRSFMFAGTPRVICSLWKVDDEATSALMVKFYELWAPKDGKPGLPTAEALRQAQDWLRSQEKWKHPYYWAAWVLWGLPS